ncbi:8-oxo-dGTP pyrophosphatase MutT (NUDIX family) [Sphingomonas zeicaulis]|uniref:NUDIX hydrolase n=1 Tax=Sphingomonas zeicaulis TaxID=1632740 RepID=UPI003D1A222A
MRVTQSAALPWRRLADGGVAVLLVTSRRTRRWIIPKGHIERGMTAAASAAKEALEEAGVTGRVGGKMGTFEYDKLLAAGGVRRLRVSVFPLEVAEELDRWEEQALRERAWFAPEHAAAAIAEAELQALIRRWIAKQAG